MPRYGTLNSDYLASWFERDEPGGPMWALNLMKYRERAEYADGRETNLTGAEADDVYLPHEHLAAVGSRIILIAPVVPPGIAVSSSATDTPGRSIHRSPAYSSWWRYASWLPRTRTISSSR